MGFGAVMTLKALGEERHSALTLAQQRNVLDFISESVWDLAADSLWDLTWRFISRSVKEPLLRSL